MSGLVHRLRGVRARRVERDGWEGVVVVQDEGDEEARGVDMMSDGDGDERDELETDNHPGRFLFIRNMHF